MASSGIEITRDLKDIKAELKSVESQIKSAAKEASGLKKAMKLDPSDTRLAEARYKELAIQVDACSKKLRLLKEQQDVLVEKNGPEAKLTPQYQKLQNEILKTEASQKSLQKELDKANKTDFSKLQKNLEKTSKVCAGILAGVVSIGVAFAASADEIQKKVDKFGGTAEEWQYQSNAWDKLTGDASAYESVLSAVTSVQGQVQKESSKTGTVLEQLGLTFDDLQGKTSAEALQIYLSALSAIGDEATRQSVAVALFGANVGTYMAQMAGTGAESIDKWNEELREAGVLTNEEVANGAALQDTFDYLKQSIVKLVATLGTSLKPMIESIVSIIKTIAPILGGIGQAFASLGAPIQSAIVVFMGLMSILPGVISLLGALHVASGNIAMGALVFTVLAAVAGIAAGVVSALTSPQEEQGYELGDYQESGIVSSSGELMENVSAADSTGNVGNSSSTVNNYYYDYSTMNNEISNDVDADEVIERINEKKRVQIGG